MFKVNVKDEQAQINDSTEFSAREDAIRFANRLRDLKVTMVEVIDCSRDKCIFRSTRPTQMAGDANAESN